MCKSSGNVSDAAGNMLSVRNEVDFCPQSRTEVIVAHFVCLYCWLCRFPAEKSGHQPLFEFTLPTS